MHNLGTWSIPETREEWNRAWARLTQTMMILGFAVVGGGGLFALYSCAFLYRALPATGTIVELVESESQEGVTLYSPVFTFVDEKGVSQRIPLPMASSEPLGTVGEEFELSYWQGNPKRLRVDDFFSHWGFALILAGIGLGMSLQGWCLEWVRKRAFPG